MAHKKKIMMIIITRTRTKSDVVADNENNHDNNTYPLIDLTSDVRWTVLM